MHDVEFASALAKIDIAQVISRLARGTDRRDETLLRSCYHSDATDDHNMFRGSATEFVDLIMSAATTNWAITSHTLSPPIIEVLGMRAWAETTAIGHHVMHQDSEGHRNDFVIGARYEDSFERRDGQWRISHRTVIYDWAGRLELISDGLASRTMPFPEHFTIGTRDGNDPSYAARTLALTQPDPPDDVSLTPR